MDENRGSRDTKYTSLGYNMGMISESVSEMYNRPSTSQIHSNNDLNDVQGPPDTPGAMTSESNMINQEVASNSVINIQRGLKRSLSNTCFGDNTIENRQVIVPHSQTINVTQNCLSDNTDSCFTNLCAPKKSPPSNGKKTKGRVKIKMEYIDNKLRRYTTFSKRKTGIMKKAYELSTLTGTQVMLLVASETGHVYTFATRKLQPMITSEAGKALIQTCLNSPDPPLSSLSGDQRMSATGFEETELTYNISDDDQKVRQLVYGSPQGSGLHVTGYTSTASSQSTLHASPSLSQHTHLLAHTHSSQSSHLVPCSSPNPMLTVSPYIQSCSSPLTSHATFNPHVTHSHNQR